jgi:hypothetical protein
MSNFNNLEIPNTWKHYWSKYPEGYTILEALIGWVSEVNDLVTNVNDWNVRLDDFIATFDTDLQQTVTDILADWQASGLFDEIIKEAVLNLNNDGVIKIGIDAAKNAPLQPIYDGAHPFYKNIAIGGGALEKATGNRNNIAIGWDALPVADQDELYNIAIGNESLWALKRPAAPADFRDGTRNVAIGINALRYATNAYQNIAIGRNTLQCSQYAKANTAVGVNAMAGSAPLDLTKNIVNQTQSDASYNTALGYNALLNITSNDNTAVGTQAAEAQSTAVNTTAIGRMALQNLQLNTTKEGYVKNWWSRTGTYTINGTIISVTFTAHGLQTGDLISLALTSGTGILSTEEVIYPVTVINADTFTVVSPQPLNTNGACSSSWWTHKVVDTGNYGNNTAVGFKAMINKIKGQNNVALGAWALQNNVNDDMNTAIGALAMANQTTGEANTAVGYGALRSMVDGSNATTVRNSTAIGYNSAVSGDAQLQLGNSGTTTYAYGAVQNRSDMRDKADIQPTALGLDFINKLKPVDFKWDYRQDYIQRDEEGNVTYLPKDGSKKRARFHHGLIAQDVKEVIEQTGVDFGGFQDHAVNGGNDVLSIGYEELIAPLIKAVQELTARVKELEGAVK